MVKHPRDYPWSSYKANAEGKNNELLTPHEQYRHLDRHDLARRQTYRALFKAHIDQPIDDEIRKATNGNYVLGNPRFQEQIARALGRRVTRGKAGRPRQRQDDH